MAAARAGPPFGREVRLAGSIAPAAPATETSAAAAGFLAERDVVVRREIERAEIQAHVLPGQDAPLPGANAEPALAGLPLERFAASPSARPGARRPCAVRNRRAVCVEATVDERRMPLPIVQDRRRHDLDVDGLAMAPPDRTMMEACPVLPEEGRGGSWSSSRLTATTTRPGPRTPLHLRHPGKRLRAGAAPGCPEVQHHHLALVRTEVEAPPAACVERGAAKETATGPGAGGSVA